MTTQTYEEAIHHQNFRAQTATSSGCNIMSANPQMRLAMQGLSVIGLSVVIAIIAALIRMLLLAFGNARVRRRQLALIGLALALAMRTAVHAQFAYTTNDGAITITQYTGPGGHVVIPNTINGLPVTRIGN